MIGRLWLKWKQYRAEMARQKVFRDRRKKLRTTAFGIIANNCWGGEIYKYFDLPFNTPFIGLFLYPDCFLTLLENWKHIDIQEITLGHSSKYHEAPLSYPVGLLAKGIEIHFLHYKTVEEAESKWKRRAARLIQISNPDHLFVRFCDRDGATDSHFKRFAALPFSHKISFSAIEKPVPGNRVTKSEEKNPAQADDGVNVFHYELANGFDLVGWLNG